MKKNKTKDRQMKKVGDIMSEEEEVKQKRKKRLFSKVKLKTILLLSITLLFNTYAWFLYRTKVSMNLTANVRKWEIVFTENDQTITETTFVVADAYPGMESVSKEIAVINNGEIAADVEIEITEATIFGNTNHSFDQFPFEIEVEVDKTPISPGEETTARVIFIWTYKADSEELEEKKDENDTKYGKLAADYDGDNDIELKLQLVAKQYKESSN